jgi:nitroimidazol reductase NimA-like FMN-containing flavoprotein (pyridoxamine 5'-phosphate oxidase superfamily)
MTAPAEQRPAPRPPTVPGAPYVVAAMLSLPRTGVRLVHGLLGDAVGNAREAGALLRDQVAQRRQLAPVAEEPGPGDLSRLDRSQCLELLGSQVCGRLAYVARAGVPDVVPVNYSVHAGHLLIRSGPGPKLQAAERRERVALQIDEIDHTRRTGWSVVVIGRARRLSVQEQRALLPEEVPETWAAGPRMSVLAVRMERVDGRRLH